MHPLGCCTLASATPGSSEVVNSFRTVGTPLVVWEAASGLAWSHGVHICEFHLENLHSLPARPEPSVRTGRRCATSTGERQLCRWTPMCLRCTTLRPEFFCPGRKMNLSRFCGCYGGIRHGPLIDEVGRPMIKAVPAATGTASMPDSTGNERHVHRDAREKKWEAQSPGLPAVDGGNHCGGVGTAPPCGTDASLTARIGRPTLQVIRTARATGCCYPGDQGNWCAHRGSACTCGRFHTGREHFSVQSGHRLPGWSCSDPEGPQFPRSSVPQC